jgi:hypothetical protein
MTVNKNSHTGVISYWGYTYMQLSALIIVWFGGRTDSVVGMPSRGSVVSEHVRSPLGAHFFCIPWETAYVYIANVYIAKSKCLNNCKRIHSKGQMFK